MNSQSRRMRVILSVIGLLCAAILIALTFAAPGTFWNWALLLVVLGFLLLSRRYQ
jgi:peptidoglycan/LPS O-acetylase OafA/YrhL